MAPMTSAFGSVPLMAQISTPINIYYAILHRGPQFYFIQHFKTRIEIEKIKILKSVLRILGKSGGNFQSVRSDFIWHFPKQNLQFWSSNCHCNRYTLNYFSHTYPIPSTISSTSLRTCLNKTPWFVNILTKTFLPLISDATALPTEPKPF